LVNPRNWFAEGVATYCLVFFGPLSVILAAAAFGTGLSIEGIIMISLAHGGAILLPIYRLGFGEKPVTFALKSCVFDIG